MTDSPTSEPSAPLPDPWQAVLDWNNSRAGQRYRGFKLVAISGFISLFAIIMFIMLLYAGTGWMALLALCGLWVIPAFTLPGIRLLRSTRAKNDPL